MFWRGAALSIVAVCLSGCASQRTGFDYAGVMQKVGPPRPGQTRIVVLEEKASGLTATACDVKVDGGPMGQLKPGTYVYADRPAGLRFQFAQDGSPDALTPLLWVNRHETNLPAIFENPMQPTNAD